MIRFFLAFGLFFITLFTAVCVADEKHVQKVLPPLATESLKYDIDFLFFKRLAEGSLTFEETEHPGIFRVELIGKTLGVASWLSGDRTQTYTTTMQVLPDGSFSPLGYVSRVKKKKWGEWRSYKKVYRFDYEKGKIFVDKVKGGVVTSSKEHDLPEGKPPVDLLTAFYNLRLGAYGALHPGRIILIPTYSSKGFHEIEVKVLTKEEQKNKKYFPGNGMLVKAVIDPEIFETDSGSLYVWFDDNGVPARGIIEDMIGLGDVKGHLMEELL